MATLPFLHQPPFSGLSPLSSKNFGTPPKGLNFWKALVPTHPLIKGGYNYATNNGIFISYFFTLNFDSLTTKVCLRLRCWCFFSWEKELLSWTYVLTKTTQDKNINISNLKIDFKILRHTVWAHANRSTMQ